LLIAEGLLGLALYTGFMLVVAPRTIAEMRSLIAKLLRRGRDSD
jgi:hypothetical protein